MYSPILNGIWDWSQIPSIIVIPDSVDPRSQIRSGIILPSGLYRLRNPWHPRDQYPDQTTGPDQKYFFLYARYTSRMKHFRILQPSVTEYAMPCTLHVCIIVVHILSRAQSLLNLKLSFDGQKWNWVDRGLMLVHTCICLGGLQFVRANGQKKLFIVWTGSLVWIDTDPRFGFFCYISEKLCDSFLTVLVQDVTYQRLVLTSI